MSAVLDHFARNKGVYGSLLAAVGLMLYQWGPQYQHVSEVLVLLGTFLGGSVIPSSREAKAKQVDAAKFEENVRKYQD